MPSLDFLVPSALIPTDFVPELMRDLRLPHLTAFAAQADESEWSHSPEGNGSRTWEDWVLRDSASRNITMAQACHDGVDLAGQSDLLWWLCRPVGVTVARDHLILNDPQTLALPQDDANALLRSAEPAFEEHGWVVKSGLNSHWYLGRPAPFELYAPDLMPAIGQNVAFYMPEGPEVTRRGWLKLLNEVQMSWHDHPVNQLRERRGQAPVNSIWLTGTGTPVLPDLPYATVTSGPSWLEGARHRKDGDRLVVYEAIGRHALVQDWSGWRNAVQALDVALGEALGALRSGTLASVRLVMFGEAGAHIHELRRSALWKFWRRGEATELFAA